jgi:hypothetical protein
MSKESHSFSVSVAQQIGVYQAIILQHFIFLQKSVDGGWVKKSAKALRETYPYLTEKEIRGAIDRMERDGFLVSRIENELKADRTKSYFVTREGFKVYDIDPIDKRANGVPERANDNYPKGQMHYSYNSFSSSSNSQADFENDWKIKETFVSVRRIPETKYATYLDAFSKEIAATGEAHNNRAQLVKHFLNWSEIRYRIETTPARAASTTGAPQSKFTPAPQEPRGAAYKPFPKYDY